MSLIYDHDAKFQFEHSLFETLMKLCENNPGSFVYKDFFTDHESRVFRIFSYEIPKRNEFKLDGAMDSRGTMFLISTNPNQRNPKLLCLPMQKFFSIGETLVSTTVDTSSARAFIKEDGSLLTTYLCPMTDELKFKSQKQPTFKEYELVEKSVTPELIKELTKLYTYGICVDLELTTPKNRVFMEYKDHKVHVLRARSMCNGESVDLRSHLFKNVFREVTKFLVKEVPMKDVDLNRSDIEGYVFEMPNGVLFKAKTVPYLNMAAVINMQDRSKENEYMYEAALNECLDNIRSLYHYRRHSPNFPLEEILRKLDETEAYAKRTYLELIDRVNTLYEEYKHLERGDYARAVKDHKDIMSVLMDKYLGKAVDFKKAAVKIYGKSR
jgi:T4 RnlA family RNA ligase